jgi:hypothetical protein
VREKASNPQTITEGMRMKKKDAGCLNYSFTAEQLKKCHYRPPENVSIDSLALAVRIAKHEGVKWNYIHTSPYGVKQFVYISRKDKCGVTGERMHYTVAYYNPRTKEFHINKETVKNINTRLGGRDDIK